MKSTVINGYVFRQLNPDILRAIRDEYGKTSMREFVKKHHISPKLFRRLAKALNLFHPQYSYINGKRFDYAPDEVFETIRREYPTTSAKEVGKHIGRSNRYVLDVARAMGIKKQGFYIVNGVTFAPRTAEFVEYFAKEFPHTETQELAHRCGIDRTTARKLAVALGLEKTPEHIEAMRQMNLKKAQATLKASGKYMWENLVKYGRRFDEHVWDNITPEEKARRVAKGVATRKKTFEAERRRVNWGLPQKTKMVVVAIPHKKVEQRSRLKKIGYIETDRYVFIRPDDGINHQKIEQHAEQNFGFKFIDKPNEFNNDNEERDID